MDYNGALGMMAQGYKLARDRWRSTGNYVYLDKELTCTLRFVRDGKSETWYSSIEDESAVDWSIVEAIASQSFERSNLPPIDVDSEDDDSGNSISSVQVVSVVAMMAVVLALTGLFVDKNHPYIDNVRARIATALHLPHPLPQPEKTP